ncbi:hypothetical protein M752DRAFT_260898 [Aspergillus phoenicis ATCC 13157]|uniref:NWD NACHT-NTPase N-terminal domain-containing protein n=1 Tax=Aspergillus phoenicis ATCC 13157 TaxID=1353007 RepID=A0A370Q050_ASPPH|nr:hypothetical protein M752DRAFT_260898 [Aspergillus phoenicis ATCC 13157]
MALPSPGASSFLIASIICIPKHCLKWVNPSGSRVLSHETGKEVESLQSNRHSSEHGPEHGPVEIENIWEEAYGRILRSKLPSATTDPDSSGVDNNQMPVARQLAGLDEKRRQILMDELVEESSDNAAVIKAFNTFLKVFDSTKDGIWSVLAIYPPASISWTEIIDIAPSMMSERMKLSFQQLRQSKAPLREAIMELYRLIIES